MSVILASQARRVIIPRPDWDAPAEPIPGRRRRSRQWGRILAGRAGFSTWDVGGCNCPSCTQTFTVRGCNALPYAGVTVGVYDITGTTLLASGVTNGSGQVALSWTGTGGVVVKVTGISARFVAYSQPWTLTCGGSTTITLTVAPGCQCYIGCVIPVANTLHLTATLPHAGWTVTLTGTSGWGGAITVAGISGPVNISYSLSSSGVLTFCCNGSTCCWVLPPTGTTSCPPAFAATWGWAAGPTCTVTDPDCSNLFSTYAFTGSTYGITE